MPVLQVQTQRPHSSRGIGAFDTLPRREVLCLPNPVRVLVCNKALSAIPGNPKEADDQKAESEGSHAAQRIAERQKSAMAAAPRVRFCERHPPAAIRCTDWLGHLFIFCL